MSLKRAVGRPTTRAWVLTVLVLVSWLLTPILNARVNGPGAALVSTIGAAPAGATAAADNKSALLAFSPDEHQQIQRHGPWPPRRPARDAGNALSGKPAAMALGRQLFFDTRLSLDGQLACASCHQPARAFADGLARGVGRQVLDRHTPSLWNAGQARWLGWDGAFDSLWSQALHPLFNPAEMGASPGHLQALLQADPALACALQQLGGATATGPDATAVQLAKAIAAFVATLQSGPTAFDRFRDALARGDRRSAARYPLAAQRGLRLFIGRGNCATCHAGPLFSNGEFGDIGLPFFSRPGVVDPGRHGGITALLASPYNLLGPYSDAPPDDPALLKTRHVQAQHRNFGEFKVPSLRNVAVTAPYMHDGQLATLDQVVQHYSALNLDRLHADGEQILRPLNLSDGEAADLLAFLHSLTDPAALAWQPPRQPLHPPTGRAQRPSAPVQRSNPASTPAKLGRPNPARPTAQPTIAPCT